MGVGRQILKSIQGIWSPKARAEATVGAQLESVIVARRAHPERDMNAWLAAALQTRIRWGGRPDWWYYTSTAQFSLAGNRAPLAMGLYVLYKEEPALAAAYGNKFAEIMDPISASIADGTFFDRWRQTNPWTAEHVPIAVEAIRKSEGLDFNEFSHGDPP